MIKQEFLDTEITYLQGVDPKRAELLDKMAERINSALQAQYSTTEKLKNQFVTSKTLSKLIGNMLKQIKVKLPETLPSYLVTRYKLIELHEACLLYTSPSPRDRQKSRMP